MKVLSFFAFLLASTIAFADDPFNGTWQGDGSLNEDTRYLCKDMSFQIAQTDTNLVITKNPVSCANPGGNPLNVSWNPESFEIKDGKLLSQGRTVGQISETEIDLSRSSSADRWNETYVLKDGGLQFHQILFDIDTLFIDAQLSKK